jgi:hypothetical protein
VTARIAGILTCVFVALLPLGWPSLPWNMQPGDLLFPVVVVALLASRPAIPRHALDLFVVIYLAGSALSIPGSIAPRDSALALVKELYLAGVYFVLKTVVPTVGGLRLCRWLCGAAGVLAACSLVAAIVFYASGYVWYAVGNPMPLPYIGQVFRTNGTLQAPEFFGNVLTFVAPLAAMLAVGAEVSATWLVVLVVLALAEVLTFSKSLGGAAVALTVFFWPRWRSQPLLRAAAAGAAVALVIGFNATAIVTVRRVDVQFSKDSRIPPPDSLYGRQDDPAGADRIDLGVSYNPMSYYLVKKVAWQAFLDHPWTGIGLSTFAIEAERAYQSGRLHQAYRRVQAHSLPFGRLAETGLVGAITLAAFLVVLWRSMLQTARLPGVDGRLGWALFAGVAGLLVNSINVDAMHFRFLWFAVGLTAGIGAANLVRESR